METLTAPEDRAAYPTDRAYANFREVTGGGIAPGVLYRSASPIDPAQGQRRFTADALTKAAGVRAVVNAADCRFRFRSYEGFDDTYYATLEQVALNMSRDYASPGFREDLRNGLDFLGEYDGPYLIHGGEGVERTGFFCMVLEALMGAGRAEVEADYLRSYRDYYQLSEADAVWPQLEREALSRLLAITGAADEAELDTLDLAQATRRYLVEQIHLTDGQIDAIVTNLSGE